VFATEGPRPYATIAREWPESLRRLTVTEETSPETAKTPLEVDPLVAAHLTGIVYQARLFNRQARMNIPEQTIISEVINLWRHVMESMAVEPK